MELKDKYGVKVYRIPLTAGFTCPNRDGTKGTHGCFFCDETGSGFAAREGSIKSQIDFWKAKLRKSKKAEKFIAYFQSHSNTYSDVETLRKLYNQAIEPDIVKIDISTRPDCITDEILDLIDELRQKIDVSIETGLQTANYKTLMRLGRGHTLAEYIKSSIMIKKRGIELVSHVILDLPFDDRMDTLETAKIINVLGIDGVKIHSLYIPKGTILDRMYNEGKFKICSLDEYIDRVILFLEYLSPDITIHRLVADPPVNGVSFGNWNISKLEILNRIESEMKKRNTYQGKNYK